jgi:GT2 family glycosyltransferase
MDLSIIIVNYNVRFFLEQCLRSVRKASENTECEIFVVDNNSADGSCSMVISQFPEVRLIRNHINSGFSVANNQAIRLANGKFILLLNPDTLVEEDTFKRCLAYMKEHPETGALGVKMINGNGKLLPESKRALPTPGTAFFKMSGLSVLFPKSPLLNRYYLGHLDSSTISEAEILSGAFMFIRKEALDKTGLLDEKFFMYGEDIDLSFRILKAGYKNIYFPEVKIIHYKGESTGKGNINYIVLFYKAMIIFVKKHFSEKRHKGFFFLINTAIYFWGLIALMKKNLRKIFLPLADGILLSGFFSLLIPLWENYKYSHSYHYPEIFHISSVVIVTLLTLLSILISGGYRLPSKMADTLRGILVSSVSILIIYSILPLDLRFSRAVILTGVFTASVVIPSYRILLAIAGSGLIKNPMMKAPRTIIVGNEQVLINVRSLFSESGTESVIIGRVSTRQDDLGPEVLGNIEQIREVIRINIVNEVIFSTRELTASQIINYMNLISEFNITIKIAPAGENIILGSRSVNFKKDIFYSPESQSENSTSKNQKKSKIKARF